MRLRFSKARRVTTLEGLSPLQCKRAWLCWKFYDTESRYSSLDAMLMGQKVRRYSVHDAGGPKVAEWWQVWDAGLLFPRGSKRLLGQATQHEFVCSDHDLWRALEEADGFPAFIDWTYEDPAERAALWCPPKVPKKL